MYYASFLAVTITTILLFTSIYRRQTLGLFKSWVYIQIIPTSFFAIYFGQGEHKIKVVGLAVLLTLLTSLFIGAVTITVQWVIEFATVKIEPSENRSTLRKWLNTLFAGTWCTIMGLTSISESSPLQEKGAMVLIFLWVPLCFVGQAITQMMVIKRKELNLSLRWNRVLAACLLSCLLSLTVPTGMVLVAAQAVQVFLR